MQINVPPGNNGDLLEAREQRLMAFAATGIESAIHTGGEAVAATIFAVARSSHCARSSRKSGSMCVS